MSVRLMAMAREPRKAGPRMSLRRGLYPAMNLYASCAGMQPQLRRQRRGRGAVKKRANPGAIFDVGESGIGEYTATDTATMTMETGCSLALTSPRRSPPRRACIPVAPRERTTSSGPEPPSCAVWPREVEVNPYIGITTMGEPDALDHCNADLSTKRATTVIEKTDANPNEAEAEIGAYEFMEAGNTDLMTYHSEFQEDQSQKALPTMTRLRTRMPKGATISEIGGRASMKTRRNTGKGTGRNLALTSPRPLRPRCA